MPPAIHNAAAPCTDGTRSRNECPPGHVRVTRNASRAGVCFASGTTLPVQGRHEDRHANRPDARARRTTREEPNRKEQNKGECKEGEGARMSAAARCGGSSMRCVAGQVR